MIANFFYKCRFSYNKAGKFAILNNKINTIFANLVIPCVYRLSKKQEDRPIADDVIVSLTTYPPRIQQASFCIESLLRQTIKPNKIILWLAESDYQTVNDVPYEILKYVERGLEIRICEDLKSYKKIFYTALKFPEFRIVTADDDFFYPETWLEELIEQHNRYPQCIVCHRSHRIIQNKGKLIPYGEWDWYSNGFKGPLHSLHILTGAGAIFPKNFFKCDFFEKDVFLKLAPTTDDMWVKVYALRKNTKVVKVHPVSKSLIEILGSQRVSLISKNQSDGNSKSLNALLEYYGINIISIVTEEENNPC